MGLFGCCVILGFYEAHFRLIIVSLILRLQNVLSNKSNAELPATAILVTQHSHAAHFEIYCEG